RLCIRRPHLEALMAAHGSGAEALSRRERCVVLNVDIGGGTSKLALIKVGEVLATAAIAVGGRLVVRGEDGGLVRIEEPARDVADSVGVRLAFGEPLASEDEVKMCQAWIEVLVAAIRQEPASGVGK